MAKSDVKYVLTYVKCILFLAQSLEKHLKSIISLIVTVSVQFIFLRVSAVASNMLEKALGRLRIGGTTINVMIENVCGMRIVLRNIIVRNI